MAPKNALRSKSTGGGPGVAGLRDKREVEPRGSSLTAWMREAGTNGSRTRALDGMPARWFVTIGAVLMLMMQSSSAAEAEGGLYESLRGADIPQGPVALSSPTSTPGTEDKEELGSDVSLQPWSEVFANARTAVWTETEAVRTGENGKAFAETGIVTGTGAWVETGWRPVETQRPNVHEDPAEWPGPEHLQMSREIEREQAAFSSVLTVVSEMAELQAPAAAKPLGLLSKAAWTRSLSSVASKASSPSPAKALSLTSSASPSSSSSSAFVNESQTEASINVSVVPGNISSNNITLDESLSSLPAWDLPTVPESLLSTVGDHDVTLPANVTSPFSTFQWNTTMPLRSRNTSRLTTTVATTTTTLPTISTSTIPISTTTEAPPESTTPPLNTIQDTVTNDSFQLTTVTTTTPSTTTFTVSRAEMTTPVATTGSVVMLSTNTTTPTAPATQENLIITTTTTAQPTTTSTTTTTAPTTTVPPTTTTTTTTTTSTTITSAPTTTITTTTAPTTTTTLPSTTTMAPSTTIFIPIQTAPPPTIQTPSTTGTEEVPLPCNVTEKFWVRTVLSIELRRNRLDLILKQNLSKGLSHVLQRALNDSTAVAQVERDDCSPHNVTLGYYVTSGKTVYVSSFVVQALNAYGFDKLLSDIRQHTPLVKAVLVPVAAWLPIPSIHLQLKTVLRFVGPTDNIYSCSFVQMLEQRLGNAFDEAQDKVLETYNRLSVEIQSVSQEPGSPSVTLVYMVKNEDTILNGTISSGLLNQLTAELVGYFLFYPPLVIAERKCS